MSKAPENLKRFSTFYSLTGTLNQRIFESTGLPDKQALLSTLQSKPSKRTLDMLMPTVCNQDCTHCHFVEYEGQQFLKLDQQLVDKANELAKYLKSYDPEAHLITYPREVTAFPKILPLRQQLGQNAIYTNAALIDQKCVDNLIKYGVKTAFVSLHGSQKQHSLLTGVDKNSYNRTVSGIKLLHQNGIHINILLALHSGNLSSISSVVKFLLENDLKHLKLIRFFPAGHGKNISQNRLLKTADVIKILDKIEKIRHKYPQLSIAFYGMSFGPNFYSPNSFRFLAGQYTKYGDSRYLCPVINQDYVGISLGTHNVYPCFEAMSFPEMKIGKLTEKNNKYSLSVNKTKFDPLLLHKKLQGICSAKKCQYQEFCLGGCRMHAYAVARKKGHKNPIFAGQDICLTQILDKYYQK